MSLIVSCNIQIDHHVVYGGERGSIKVANEVAVVGHSKYLPVFFFKDCNLYIHVHIKYLDAFVRKRVHS